MSAGSKPEAVATLLREPGRAREVKWERVGDWWERTAIDPSLSKTYGSVNGPPADVTGNGGCA